MCPEIVGEGYSIRTVLRLSDDALLPQITVSWTPDRFGGTDDVAHFVHKRYQGTPRVAETVAGGGVHPTMQCWVHWLQLADPVCLVQS